MRRSSLAVMLAGAIALAGCGRGEETPGQPSADERAKLTNVAKKLDDQGTIDTSPDSMVPADEGAASGDNATTAPPDSAPPTVNSSNAAAPR